MEIIRVILAQSCAIVAELFSWLSFNPGIDNPTGGEPASTPLLIVTSATTNS